MKLVKLILATLVTAMPSLAMAADEIVSKYRPGGIRGLTVIWLLANFSYAGMRAQNHPSTSWRVVSFVCGFPLTFVSFLSIREGGGSVYGVKLPVERKGTPNSPESSSS